MEDVTELLIAELIYRKFFTSKKSSEFDWKHMKLMGIGPCFLPPNIGSDTRTPIIVNTLYLGQPKNHRLAIFADGITVSSIVTINSKYYDHVILANKPDSICLILELERNTIQFIKS